METKSKTTETSSKEGGEGLSASDKSHFRFKPGAKEKSGIIPALRIIGIFFFLYLFLLGIKGMGSGLKIMAKDPETAATIQSLFDYTSNPFVALAVGILITVLVQSSSFTTSFIISLVGPGFTIAQAVPAILGANIGTSITNTLVSLAHIGRRREFRIAFAAAIVHDVFNFLCVIVFFPLEMMFGVLSKTAHYFADFFPFPDDIEKSSNFVKTITKPVINASKSGLESLGMTSSTAIGGIITIASLAIMFIALVMLVKILKSLMLTKLENLFERYIFTNVFTALVVGLIVTIMVQSSSVTTSVIIPFVGAGLLSVRQVFPYMVGANIGTTCTGLIAAAAKGTNASLTIGFVHLLFNIFGTAIFLPLRSLPIGIARRFALMATKRKKWVLAYIFGIFVILPGIGIYLYSLFGKTGG